MVKARQIYEFIDEIAPFSTQVDYDNAGFLMGDREADVERVLVALDVTPEVVREAKRKRCGLILTHHPLIFHPMKSVTGDDTTGEVVRALVKGDISLISAHTNLDMAQGGVNDALMETLGVVPEAVFEPVGERNGVVYGSGRTGHLAAPMAPRDFARYVKAALHAKGLRAVLGDRPVQRVAVCGGSCGYMVDRAVALGMDAYVTADVKYHEFLEAHAKGLTLIDGGHFATENVVVPVLCQRLSERFDDRLEVLASSVHKEVYFAL